MTAAQLILLFLPFILIPLMIAIFACAKRHFPPHRAYLMGFLVYWSIGGLLIPLGLIPAVDLEQLFTVPDQPFGNPELIGVASLLLPVLISPFFTSTLVRLRRITLATAIASLLFALINGTAEELLWHGAYLTVFRDAPLWGYIYPSIAFGLWHFAPQIVEPADNGRLQFSISTIFLGLALGWTAFQTGSILLPVIAHILLDMAGLAGLELIGSGHPKAVQTG